jgi:lipopolysaccharide transport system ATP-binding protein
MAEKGVFAAGARDVSRLGPDGSNAILVEGLGKRFRRRRRDGGMFRRWESFWAIKDLSFAVPEGAAFGIIGPNGAGKSTLLRVLTRITEPSEGRAEVRGRVGALLEVGTGFHPDLSGRDNVFLSGALLGMRRAEIAERFEEIVAFAEVGPFIDTAVKHYSSGMYVRLAFAVAAHLRADILIADEVLAVGDVSFQNKCVAKMSEVALGGRTVLFVSHNMAVVQKLCSSAVLIEGGRLAAEGPTASVVGAYLDRAGRKTGYDLSNVAQREGKGEVRLMQIVVLGKDEAEGRALSTGGPASLLFHLDRRMPGLSCSFTIYDESGQPVTYFDSAEHGRFDVEETDGGTAFRCDIPELLLVPGRYRVNAALALDGIIQDHVIAAAVIDVHQGLLDGRPILRGQAYGSAVMRHRWTVPS